MRSARFFSRRLEGGFVLTNVDAKKVNALIFRRVSSRGAEELASDPVALQVLRLLDGKRDVAAVGLLSGLGLTELMKVVIKLCKMHLAESAGTTSNNDRVASEAFVKQLVTHFSLAVGPIASLMIEEALTPLGYGLDHIPQAQVENLVQRLADSVQEEAQRIEFIRAMQLWVAPLKQ